MAETTEKIILEGEARLEEIIGQVEDLGKAFEAGELSAQQYADALHETKAQARLAAAQQKKANKIIRATVTNTYADAQRSLTKYNTAQRKSASETKRVAQLQVNTLKQERKARADNEKARIAEVKRITTLQRNSLKQERKARADNEKARNAEIKRIATLQRNSLNQEKKDRERAARDRQADEKARNAEIKRRATLQRNSINLQKKEEEASGRARNKEIKRISTLQRNSQKLERARVEEEQQTKRVRAELKRLNQAYKKHSVASKSGARDIDKLADELRILNREMGAVRGKANRLGLSLKRDVEKSSDDARRSLNRLRRSTKKNEAAMAGFAHQIGVVFPKFGLMSQAVTGFNVVAGVAVGVVGLLAYEVAGPLIDATKAYMESTRAGQGALKMFNETLDRTKVGIGQLMYEMFGAEKGLGVLEYHLRAIADQSRRLAEEQKKTGKATSGFTDSLGKLGRLAGTLTGAGGLLSPLLTWAVEYEANMRGGIAANRAFAKSARELTEIEFKQEQMKLAAEGLRGPVYRKIVKKKQAKDFRRQMEEEKKRGKGRTVFTGQELGLGAKDALFKRMTQAEQKKILGTAEGRQAFMAKGGEVSQHHMRFDASWAGKKGGWVGKQSATHITLEELEEIKSRGIEKLEVKRVGGLTVLTPGASPSAAAPKKARAGRFQYPSAMKFYTSDQGLPGTAYGQTLSPMLDAASTLAKQFKILTDEFNKATTQAGRNKFLKGRKGAYEAFREKAVADSKALIDEITKGDPQRRAALLAGLESIQEKFTDNSLKQWDKYFSELEKASRAFYKKSISDAKKEAKAVGKEGVKSGKDVIEDIKIRQAFAMARGGVRGGLSEGQIEQAKEVLKEGRMYQPQPIEIGTINFMGTTAGGAGVGAMAAMAGLNPFGALAIAGLGGLSNMHDPSDIPKRHLGGLKEMDWEKSLRAQKAYEARAKENEKRYGIKLEDPNRRLTQDPAMADAVGSLQASGITDAAQQGKIIRESLKELMDEKTKSSTEQMTQTVDKLRDSFVDLGGASVEALTQMAAAGTLTAKSFKDAMLGMIGELASAWGDYYIGQGIAASANPSAPGSGAGMIVAGIALKALGGALKGAAQRGSGRSSGGGAKGSSNVARDLLKREREEKETVVEVFVMGDQVRDPIYRVVNEGIRRNQIQPNMRR